jgi:hypothetical protein
MSGAVGGLVWGLPVSPTHDGGVTIRHSPGDGPEVHPHLTVTVSKGKPRRALPRVSFKARVSLLTATIGRRFGRSKLGTMSLTRFQLALLTIAVWLAAMCLGRLAQIALMAR